MVYVRIELWPDGDRSQARLLQEATIANDGTGDRSHGNYQVMVSHSTTFRGDGFDDPAQPTAHTIWRRATLRAWRRRNAPADLVSRALAQALRMW